MEPDTRKKFVEGLFLLIENEVKSELLRQELISSPYFSIKVAFCSFDPTTHEETSTSSSRLGSISKKAL